MVMTAEAALLAQQFAAVQARIRAAELTHGRPAGSVQLLAVSKQQPAEQVRAVYHAGQRAFGESYVNEALAKQAALPDLIAAEWHFIGRIQSNKTALIAQQFAWVHSLADIQHAERLSAARPPALPPLQVCIQVNTSGELSKNGLDPAAVPAFIAAVRQLPQLSIAGLMTLPAPTPHMHEQRQSFAALRALRDYCATPTCPLATLSMGMSDDLEAAIAEGATLVRIGSALFGPRAP